VTPAIARPDAVARARWAESAVLRDRPALAELVHAAADVRTRAYAPYSGFAVGAALRTISGRVYCGVNVENASYPVSCCAERSAVCAAISAGERQFEAIAIVTDAATPAAPCGLCRQTLCEFGLDLHVILASAAGAVWSAPLRDLLPAAFTPDSFEPRPGRTGPGSAADGDREGQPASVLTEQPRS